MTFEELNLTTPLINALKDLDYIQPTPIQESAFPVIMSGRDVVGIAQTGTGKTFAYLLPLLRQLTFTEQKNPRILIVVPTRELVLQIVREIEKLTKYISVRYEGVYGGTNINTQKQLIYNGIDILVATPGRLMDLAHTGILRLKSVHTLVIDEVDKMLGLGFRTELLGFLESLPIKRQNLLFSATLNEEVEAVINTHFFAAQKIVMAAHGTPLDKIIQKGYHVPNFNTKVNLLELLLVSDAELSKVLVFVGNRKLADRLHVVYEKTHPDMFGVIHSHKSQNNRIKALKQFQEGIHRVLIATDIAARGLDISDVTHIINFDTPELPEDYIHRIGRTGRANKDGVAITFINEAEQVFQDGIEEMMNKRIPMEELPEDLEISNIFIEEEKAARFKKVYVKTPSLKNSKGNLHEKKEKNKKINLGGPSSKQASKGKTARYYRKNN